jgi:hypothetical protein
MGAYQVWGRARRAVPANDVTDADVEDFIDRRADELDAERDAMLRARPPIRRPVSTAARWLAWMVLAGFVVAGLVPLLLWLKWAP